MVKGTQRQTEGSGYKDNHEHGSPNLAIAEMTARREAPEHRMDATSIRLIYQTLPTFSSQFSGLSAPRHTAAESSDAAELPLPDFLDTGKY